MAPVVATKVAPSKASVVATKVALSKAFEGATFVAGSKAPLLWLQLEPSKAFFECLLKSKIDFVNVI